ncbi:hypothetical protein [Streptomyces sp. RK9]
MRTLTGGTGAAPHALAWLYEEAEKKNIHGRSSMNKRELKQALGH